MDFLESVVLICSIILVSSISYYQGMVKQNEILKEESLKSLVEKPDITGKELYKILFED